MNLLVRHDNDLVGILVEEVGGLQAIPWEAAEPLPGGVSAELGEVVSRIVKLEDSLLLVLDIDAAIEKLIDTEQVAATSGPAGP